MDSSTFQPSERTVTALSWTDLLTHLSHLCHTDRGKAAALALPFQETVEEVETELQRVSEARSLHAQGDPPPFGGVLDLRLPLRRLDKEGILDAPTLLQVAGTLRAGARLRQFLLGHAPTARSLARIASRVEAMDDVSGPILDAVDERGVLADHASRDLGRLRKRRVELHERLSKRMRNLMEKPTIAKFLQDRFYTQREDRYVLPIRSDAGPAVEGIVHGSSASGATLFVEPREVVGLNNELKVAEMEVTREEMRILTELSALVREDRTAIWSNLELLERLDVVDGRARLAIRLDAYPPLVSRDGRLSLLAMRHPLMVLSDMHVVQNDLAIDPGQSLIVSGPNAGGKTVCLKTAGLCALMLRAGMHLPTGPDSELPLYGAILAEMGDDQSIERNLSTFTAHIEHLRSFLQQAGPTTLILLDEIAVGTDPGEGSALAQALLESIAERGSHVVVTTHYEQLKSLPVQDPRFVNASVGFDLEQMSPTYRLHTGVPGSSGALAVARRMGLSEGLVERARTLMDEGGQELSRLLTVLAGERTRLVEAQEALSRATREADRRSELLQAELEKLRRQEKRALDQALQHALAELKIARQDLERVRALLRLPPTKERVVQADRQISQAARRILPHEPQKPVRGEPARLEDLLPGTPVLVPALGGEGEVLETPQRGRVLVRVGGLRTQVAKEGVRLLPRRDTSAPAARAAGRPAPASTQPRARGATDTAQRSETPIRTAANTLDLRGFRVDEALSEVDRGLDHALRSGEQVIYIIHGHGTGALRSAIRSHLPHHVLMERFHPAAPEDGGDGVTVVWLK